MLETALLVAARRAQVEREKVATAKLLDQLPIEVLREIAETGEIKLAFAPPCSPDGSPSCSWVDQFKGTPFFQQAIALEQEDLQAQTANQQSSAVQRQKMDQEYAVQDQIRLKKKLLELQKARNEAQVLDGGAGPPGMAGSPDPAGTAPGGPAGPPMEDLKTVTASVTKEAISSGKIKDVISEVTDVDRLKKFKSKMHQRQMGSLRRSAAHFDAGRTPEYDKAIGQQHKAWQAKSDAGDRILDLKSKTKEAMDPKLMAGVKSVAGAGPKIKLKPGGDQFSARSFNAEAQSIPGSRDPFGCSKSAAVVDGWAREMAREDAAKIAHVQETFAVGDAAGRFMAKRANIGEMIAQHVMKNPAKSLAIAGGVAGAAHGLLKQDGGLTDAVGEGVAGAGLGHMAGGMGSHLLKGHSLGSSAERYAAGVRRDVRKLTDSKSPLLSNKKVPDVDPPNTGG